jgi:hypothetical protein
VFINLDNIDHSIWSFTMAAPKPAALPGTNGEYVSTIFFSPDGPRFTVNNGPASLAVVSTTAGNQTEVDRTGYSYVSDVAWFTNDSRYMIVDEEPADGGVGSDELAVVPLDTLRITPIAKSKNYALTHTMTGASKIVFLTAADGLLVAGRRRQARRAGVDREGRADTGRHPEFPTQRRRRRRRLRERDGPPLRRGTLKRPPAPRDPHAERALEAAERLRLDLHLVPGEVEAMEHRPAP